MTQETDNFIEDNKNFNFSKIKNLKCGENPHQKAALYSYDKELDWEILQGSDLTYNNIIDSTTALEVISEFFDVAALAVINHGRIDAVALGVDIINAWDKILDSDPTCYYRSTISTTREVTLEFAKKISALPLKVILSPYYSKDALLELKKNKNLKVVKINTPYEKIIKFNNEEIKLTPFGALIQQKDIEDLNVETFKVVTNKKPQQKEAEDMIFAFKVAKHAQSCAIVVAKDLRTLGVISGEANRSRAVELAITKVCDSLKDTVIASDGFFSTPDAVQIAAQNRICAIIQPMGSVHDKEIVDMCNKYNISMISTGIRHIKH